MEVLNYEKLIERISEIISLSKDSNNTKRICYFDIDEQYYDEFDDLIKTELVWHELEENPSKYTNSNIALKFEADKIKNDNNETLVEELNNIIDSTSGNRASDLEIVESYIIRRDLVQRFHIITKQLHIGPYIPLNVSMQKDDNRLKSAMNMGKEQFNRINESLPLKEEIPKENKEFIDSEYNNFIYLVNRGLLGKDAIKFLSTIYSDEKFTNLLNDLKKYLAITEEEYNEYYALKPGKTIYINSVDQLVDYFKNKNNLTIAGLRALEAYIGEYEFDKLVFELVKEGAISTTEYIEQYLNIHEDSIKL